MLWWWNGGDDGDTFVELIAVEELRFARLVSGPWSIPDELATDAVIAVFEVLFRDVNVWLDGVRESYLDHAHGAVRVIVAIVYDIPAEIIFLYDPEEMVCFLL